MIDFYLPLGFRKDIKQGMHLSVVLLKSKKENMPTIEKIVCLAALRRILRSI